VWEEKIGFTTILIIISDFWTKKRKFCLPKYSGKGPSSTFWKSLKTDEPLETSVKEVFIRIVKYQRYSISVQIRNQLDVTFVLSFISPLQVAQHVSDNHVPIFRSWRLRSVIATCWYCAAQYQHVAITLRSRQLLKMGTWFPETCSAICKAEIKDNTKVTSSWFLIHTELRCTVNHTSDIQFQLMI